jgi:hypothetical protein
MPIDIKTGATIRPGGVPIHVVRPIASPTIAGGPGLVNLPSVIASATHTVRTFDPFAFVGRFRKSLGRTLSK